MKLLMMKKRDSSNSNGREYRKRRIKEYTIKLGTYFKNDTDNGVSTNTVPIKYKDELYIVAGVDIENYTNINKYENQIEESRIYVYKLDLENESSENILTKSLSKDGESKLDIILVC